MFVSRTTSSKVMSLTCWLLMISVLVECNLMVNSSMPDDKCSNVKTSLNSLRKRRHLTFPDGSDFVMTISLVKAFMTHAPSGWNIALEIDVLYPLPDSKMTNALFRRKLHHKQKREFWEKLQGAINLQNMNGRSCVLRSVCEMKNKLAPVGRSLIHDILRAIFTAPLHEELFREEIKHSYFELLDPEFCEKPNDCPISVLDFVMTLNKLKY